MCDCLESASKNSLLSAMLYNAEKLKGLKQEGLRHAPLSTTTPPYTHRNFYPEHIRSMQLAKLWPSILCLVAAIAIYHFWRTIDEEKMVAIQVSNTQLLKEKTQCAEAFQYMECSSGRHPGLEDAYASWGIAWKWTTSSKRGLRSFQR